MLVATIEAELGLDSGAVDAKAMETLSRSLGQLHVLFAAVCVDREGNLKVQASHNLGVRELPHMDVVTADDTWQTLNVLADLGNGDVLRGRLQENSRRGSGEGNRGLQDDERNEQGDGRIAVQLSRPVCEPDNQCSDDDTNVSESVSEHMQHHGVHSHISVVMASSFGGLLRLGMVVAVVNARVASGPTLGAMATRGSVGSTVTAIGRILEKRGLLVRLCLRVCGRRVLAGVAFGRGCRVVGGGDDVLSEAGRIDADIIDAREAGVARLTGPAAISTTRLASGAAAGFVAPADAPSRVGAVSRRRAAGLGGDSFGCYTNNGALFVGSVVCVAVAVALLDVVAVRVILAHGAIAMAVFMSMAVIVAVAAENNEAKEV